MVSDLLVHDRAHNSLPSGVGFVEECVEEGQKCVTYRQVMFRAPHQRGVCAKHSWILGLETKRWIKGMVLMNEKAEEGRGDKDLSFI